MLCKIYIMFIVIFKIQYVVIFIFWFLCKFILDFIPFFGHSYYLSIPWSKISIKRKDVKCKWRQRGNVRACSDLKKSVYSSLYTDKKLYVNKNFFGSAVQILPFDRAVRHIGNLTSYARQWRIYNITEMCNRITKAWTDNCALCFNANINH
jgi:hypothetical protein